MSPIKMQLNTENELLCKIYIIEVIFNNFHAVSDNVGDKLY